METETVNGNPVRLMTIVYNLFTRTRGRINELSVPALALRRDYNGIQLDEFELCDYVDGEFQPNTEKDKKEKQAIISNSPRMVYSYGNVFVMVPSETSIEYRKFYGGIVVPAKKKDYVLGDMAASRYLGISKKGLGMLRESGQLTPLRPYGLNRGNYKAYLLSEMNHVKEKVQAVKAIQHFLPMHV